MQNEQKDYSILDCKTFIFWIFSRCDDLNKELAFNVVKAMYGNSSSLSRKDINHILWVDVSYSIIERLEESIHVNEKVFYFYLEMGLWLDYYAVGVFDIYLE